VRDNVDERLTLDGVPPHDRQDAWGQMLSDVLLPMSIRLPTRTATGFRGRLRRQWLDDMALVECRTEAFTPTSWPDLAVLSYPAPLLMPAPC